MGGWRGGGGNAEEEEEEGYAANAWDVSDLKRDSGLEGAGRLGVEGGGGEGGGRRRKEEEEKQGLSRANAVNEEDLHTSIYRGIHPFIEFIQS